MASEEEDGGPRAADGEAVPSMTITTEEDGGGARAAAGEAAPSMALEEEDDGGPRAEAGGESAASFTITTGEDDGGSRIGVGVESAASMATEEDGGPWVAAGDESAASIGITTEDEGGSRAWVGDESAVSMTITTEDEGGGGPQAGAGETATSMTMTTGEEEEEEEGGGGPQAGAGETATSMTMTTGEEEEEKEGGGQRAPSIMADGGTADTGSALHSRYYTPSEVAAHNTMTDLWVSYLGRVRDLSPLVQEHQGDVLLKPILEAAGQDISHWFDEEREDVCSEETLNEILERYITYNAHAASYTWKYDGVNLDMENTLEENGIEDEDETMDQLRMEPDYYRQSILLYFNDDLTEL
ncbi:cytochrome b5 domain-containing protein 1 isoform X2 [Rhinoraja longicauda]